MTEWIDFSVYAAQIVTLWIIFPAMSSRFTALVVADRNPELLAAHPELLERFTDNRWFIRSCHIWGAVSLVVLLSFLVGIWPQAMFALAPDEERWDVLKDINSLLLSMGLFCCTVFGVVWVRRFHRQVPLAERRQATLERRSLDDFASRWLVMAIYVAIGLHAAAWLTVGILNLYSTRVFWVQFGLVVVLSAIFLLALHAGVNRRPHAMDRIFGSAYRRTEVHFGLLAQLLPLVNVVRLYEEVTRTVLVDFNRAMHLSVALFVAVNLLRFATLSSSDGDSNAVTGDAGPDDLLTRRAISPSR
jgi:hypothetical protein